MRTALALILGLLVASPVMAADAPKFELTIKDHKFEPAELKVPARQSFTVVVKNLDNTAEEIESGELKIEKAFAGKHDGILRVRPMEPGRHEFVGEYHADTAKGAFIAE